ncbi:MAG: hypothetical protein O3B73_14355 [bacterium]|nr:hypothetical protein [bacterium]
MLRVSPLAFPVMSGRAFSQPNARPEPGFIDTCLVGTLGNDSTPTLARL